MNQLKGSRTRPRSALYGVITVAWMVLGMALSMMCIKIFGNNTAAIGVPALVVASALIWYFTGRRDRHGSEENL